MPTRCEGLLRGKDRRKPGRLPLIRGLKRSMPLVQLASEFDRTEQ
jgi:hypothetical protein